MAEKWWIGALSAVALLLYPFAIWYGLSIGGIEWLIWIVVLAFLLRIWALSQLKRKTTKNLAWVSYTLVFLGALLVTASALLKNYELLFYYPVAVNVILLCLFALSLRGPMTVIERLARLQQPDLPQTAVRYTYRVTQVWCLFFIVNGSIALWTCLNGNLDIWMLYNGLISYLLIGTLMALEWGVRKYVQRKNPI